MRWPTVDDAIEWTLDPDQAGGKNKTQAKRARSGSRISECTQCGALREGGKPCPACGFLPRARPDIVLPREGELVEITQQCKARLAADAETKRRWHGMLAGYARERGHKLGWAAHKFEEKFGHWPAERFPIAIDPSPEVRGWIRSRNIAWAKVQEREDAAR